MKGIEKIKKKIMGDADAAVKKLSEKANAEVKIVRTKQKAEQEEYKEDFEERTKALVKGLKQKNLAKARLDVKKDILKKREEIIDNMIGEVLEKLDHNSKNYERFLKKMADENLSNLSGEIVVTCSKKDVALVNKIVGEKAKIEQSSSLSGGLIFEDAKGQRVDDSITAVLERKRDEIRKEIASIIR